MTRKRFLPFKEVLNAILLLLCFHYLLLLLVDEQVERSTAVDLRFT